MREKQLRKIFDKTKGHCHFCGDPIVFEKRGGKRVKNAKGYWEVDHVIQRAKGGASSMENYLPACTLCNRLRWHRTGVQIRELLLLGLIAHDEIKKDPDLGNRIAKLSRKRKLKNNHRRKSK